MILVSVKCQTSTIIYSLGIKYSMRDLSYCSWVA